MRLQPYRKNSKEPRKAVTRRIQQLVTEYQMVNPENIPKNSIVQMHRLYLGIYLHVHTHTHRERERERELCLCSIENQAMNLEGGKGSD